MPLRDKNQFPPNGWIFFQPETGWYAPNPMSDSEERTLDLIIAMRLANPRHKLPTDREIVRKELHDFTCKRLNYDPVWCFPEIPEPLHHGVALVKGIPISGRIQKQLPCSTCGQN